MLYIYLQPSSKKIKNPVKKRDLISKMPGKNEDMFLFGKIRHSLRLNMVPDEFPSSTYSTV